MSELPPPTLADPASPVVRPPRAPIWAGVPGPVFMKEVWLSGKRSGVAWMRTVYLLLVLGVVVMVFMGQASQGGLLNFGVGSSVAQVQAFQRIAPAVSLAVLWCQFILLMLLGGAMGSTAINEERRTGTLATLLTTPLTSWQIILGKLLGRSVELLILLLLALPLLLGIRVYGGASAPWLFVGTLICISAMLFTSQLGILFSVRTKRTVPAMVGVMVTLAILWLGVPVVLALIAELFGINNTASRILLQAMGVVCLPISMMEVSGRILGEGGIPGMRNSHFWIWSVLFHLLLVVLLFFISSAMLRRVMLLDGVGAPVSKPKRVRGAPKIDASTTTPQAAARPERSSRVVGDRPVLWRELQQQMVTRPVLRWLGIVLGALLILVIYYLSALDDVQVVLSIVGVLVAMIAGSLVAGGALAQEREGRTLEVLLTTPLSAWEIVWSKYLGAFRKALVVPMLIAIHLIVSGFAAPEIAKAMSWLDPYFFDYARSWSRVRLHPIGLVLAILIALGPAVFLPAVGVYFSSVFKRSSSALVATLAVALALWGGLPLFLGVLHSLSGGVGERLLDLLASLALWCNPAPLMGEAVDTSMRTGSWTTLNYELFVIDGRDVNLGAIGFLGVVTLVLGLYAGAGLLLLKRTARRLKRLTGRAR